MEWQQIMGVVSLGVATYLVYLYLNGKISLGPGGKEWDVQTTSTKDLCPPPECDCALLRARIAYLERKLHDTENALLKAEGLYASLYTKYQKLLRELEETKARLAAVEAENAALRAQLAAALAELAACRAAFDALQAQCIDRDLQVNACSAGLSAPGLLR